MIKNERQYAKSERKMVACIAIRAKLVRKLHMAVNQAQAQQEIDNLQRQAELITRQMKDYIALQTRRIAPPELSEISNLPTNLIRARIALGWAPKDLARHYGVAPAQIHRWESTNYARASFSTVLAVADLLNTNLKQQPPSKHLGQPLKLGCDLFNHDFRQLEDIPQSDQSALSSATAKCSLR
jgi:transcriptional regulator with XRE-family HTH domain